MTNRYRIQEQRNRESVWIDREADQMAAAGMPGFPDSLCEFNHPFCSTTDRGKCGKKLRRLHRARLVRDCLGMSHALALVEDAERAEAHVDSMRTLPKKSVCQIRASDALMQILIITEAAFEPGTLADTDRIGRIAEIATRALAGTKGGE